VVFIEQGLRQLTDATRERIPEIYEEIRRRLRAEAHTEGAPDNPQLSSAESDTILASLNDVLTHISDPNSPLTRASNEALREVRVSVQAGVGLHDLLHASRIGQSVTWSFLLDEAYRSIPDTQERAAVLRHASARQFAWNDAVSTAIVEAFQQQSAAYALQSHERRKMATLNSLLAGLPVDTAVLDYSLRGQHLAAIVSGASPESVARTIGQHMKMSLRPLVASTPNGMGFLWIPWPRRSGQPKDELGGMSVLDGAHLAFGTVNEGLEGFRVSHRQANEAHNVGKALGLPVTWYEDTSLEALALHDTAAARAFVHEELEPLGDIDDPSNVLIETLRVYFTNGENAVLTAQKLDVHPRTVAYRLRSAESKLGAERLRRGEFAVALRLGRLVSALPSEDAGPETNPGLPTPAL